MVMFSGPVGTANTLLSVLDGVRSKNDAEIIWVVASNFNSETMQMDEAMVRRFQMMVDFRMPNQEERLAIIGYYLRQRADRVLPNLDLHHVVGEMGMYRKTRLNFGALCQKSALLDSH